jgi:hypothetical protein
MSVAIGTSATKFSAAVDKTGRIYVEGAVRSDTPYLTKIGAFDVELSVTGSVILCRQRDQPGIVAGISTLLAQNGVNISFMTVCRTARNEDAIMAIGIDEEPSAEVRCGWRLASLASRGRSCRPAAAAGPLLLPGGRCTRCSCGQHAPRPARARAASTLPRVLTRALPACARRSAWPPSRASRASPSTPFSASSSSRAAAAAAEAPSAGWRPSGAVNRHLSLWVLRGCQPFPCQGRRLAAAATAAAAGRWAQLEASARAAWCADGWWEAGQECSAAPSGLVL